MSIDTQTLVTGIKKYPIPVGCGVLAVILVALLYFRSGALAEQQADLDKYSAEGKRCLTNVSNSAQLQEQLEFLVQANGAVKARSLSATGLAENLQYFYRLESEVGIKYKDLRPTGRGSSPKGSAYVPINYVVSFEGSFAQVITYLKHLEQGSYFCRITSASASGRGSSVSINLTLDLLGIP